MKKVVLPLMALSVAFASACNSGGNNEGSADTTAEMGQQTQVEADHREDDQEFLVEAASGGLMEVQLGEYAANNAASAKVKEFGQRMVTDHGKANEELKTLAASKDITLPTAPTSDHQRHIDELKTKKGAEFDQAYMDMMVKDHEEDVKKFEEASAESQDAVIKAFAAKTVPVLRQHLEMAKSVKDGLKK